ncbi:MAG TPA: DNA cytosine methyltransferase [Pyrinomonadaceae bacterium]|nr:DNA cytosine methyltransferase [Pyrinomonadaceae bacterium]
MKELKIIDLFCGTGGISNGFETSVNGMFRTILGADILPISLETFKLNHPHAMLFCGDIRKLRRKGVAEVLKISAGDVDVIVGGPPCQGFSSIRPFRSTNDDDPRNSLFEEFASFVNFFRPKVFLIENVVGLATHKNGLTIESMEECFYKLGYDCDWKIVNAANFGVPQRRERLILVGVTKGGKFTFPNPTHLSAGETIGYKNKRKMLLAGELLFSASLSQPVTVTDAISDLPELKAGEQIDSYTKPPQTEYQKERRSRSQQLTHHITTNHTPRMLEIIRHAGPNISSIPKHLITSGFSSCYSRLDADKPAVTITVNFIHPASNRCIHPIQDRALSLREGARLQSFDDSFTFAGNKTQIAKQIGNAVPPILGRVFADEIAKIIN